MSENRRILTRYLAAVGCDIGTAFTIVMNLWPEYATIKMLQFCKDNPKATPEELLEMSLKIYSEYEDIEEIIEEQIYKDEEDF